MTRDCFIKILENIHFADNKTADKSDKLYKIRMVIRHLNKGFNVAMSNDER